MNHLGYVLSLLFLWGGTEAFAQSMVFKVVSNGSNFSDCCWIVADGEITSDTPRAFEQFVASATLPRFLRINGYGRDYDAAIDLGRLINEHDLRVTIGVSEPIPASSWWERKDGGKCRDACVMVFIGGTRRSVPLYAELVISQFHSTTLAEAVSGSEQDSLDAWRRRVEGQALTGRIVQFFAEMNVDPRLYAMTSAVELTSDGLSLTNEQVVELGLDNAEDLAGPWAAFVLDEGFVSEVSTRHSGRTLKVYCGSRGVFFVQVQLNEFFGWEYVERLFLSSGNQVTIVTDQGTGKGVVDQLDGLSNQSGSVTFQIEIETAQMIARSRSFGIWLDGELSRSEMGTLSVFTFGGISGDASLPLHTLKVCRS